MTTIEYNGINPFLGLGPTPLISHSVSMISYGNRWGQLDTYTLKGQITGTCADTISDYIDKQNTLLSGFSKDFKTLEVLDDSSVVLSRDFVKISNIRFGQSSYAKRVLPFEISIDCYPSGYFSGTYGVLSPKSETSYSEEDDGLISIVQTISAQGFPTDSSQTNAFMNAESFVNSQTGTFSATLPAFISINDLCLKEVGCTADRLNGTYQARLKYLSDTYDTVEGGVLRYTTDIASSAEAGFTNVSVKGQVNGCLTSDISSIRTRYQGFDSFSEAISQYYKAGGTSTLNPVPITKSIGEDSTHKVITFTTSYSDDLRPQIYVEYTFGFAYNFENDLISVQVQAVIGHKGPYSSTSWQDIKNFAEQIDLYSIAVPAYNEYVNLIAPALSSYQLNPNPSSKSREENQFGLSLTLSATFSNSVIPPPGLDNFELSLNFTPPIRQYAPYPILDENGQYYIFDLGFIKRGVLNLQAEGHANDTTSLSQALGQVKSQVFAAQNQYLVGTKKILAAQSYSENKKDERTVSVSATYDAEQSEFTID